MTKPKEIKVEFEQEDETWLLAHVNFDLFDQGTQNLYAALQKVAGVSSIGGTSESTFSNRYRFYIQKGNLFDWDQVQAGILSAIQEHFK